MRVALYTLGCKVNQYETQKLAEDFQSKGFDMVDFSDQAEVYVINTCTVTQTADSKSRQAVRTAIHRNPRAAVVVTGCYAETSPEKIRSIEGVDLVIGNEGKENLAELVLESTAVGRGKIQNSKSAIRPSTGSGQAIRNGRTRALLKVQDGCDQFCSYCTVPFARPVMSCRPCEEVLSEAKQLAERGFKEIVLTGIRLGVYDDGEIYLTSLIGKLVDIQGIERIRLSSIELTDIPEDLIALMAENRKLCRHIHVPLQSGDDEVLARMNRPYTAAEYISFVENVRSLIPEVAVTTDVMVGFPGETSGQFENTCNLMEYIRFARTHVFRYSPRPRTAAAEMPEDVSAAEKERRSTLLMDMAERCSHDFASSLVGKTLPIIVEGKQVRTGVWSGLTDNYVRVEFEGASHVGEIIDVRIESVTQGTACGRLVLEECGCGR